jgi:predicted N-formylglutamate amidohydrolase
MPLDVSTALHSRPLSAADPDPPVERIDGDRAGGLLLLCDHASNRVPPPYDLGLPASAFERHIAYDIGCAELTRRLAALSGAPALMTRFTRLLIDPNRGEDDPTLVMRLSDGAIVPGNAAVDVAERARRIDRFHRPYHDAIAAELDAMLAAGTAPAVVSIHSFTPAWKGNPRPWHVGILWDSDPRLNRPLIDALSAEGDVVVGDNEPYDGALKNDTMYRHATRRGLAHTLIEVRQDLIADPVEARAWADRLWKSLEPVVRDPHIREIQFIGSRTGPVDRLVEPERRRP